MASGVDLLSIPVVNRGRFEQAIDQVEIEKRCHKSIGAQSNWRTDVPFLQIALATVAAWCEQTERHVRLTDVNAIFLDGVAGSLELRTRVVTDAAYRAAVARQPTTILTG